MNVQDIKFDKDGLVPVVVQDAATNAVLMLAYMNKEAVDTTLATKDMTYYSRSRKKLWRKGETSGNVQKLHKLQMDCDGDTLLALVSQTGAACHTGSYSCFFNMLYDGKDSLADYSVIEELSALINKRKNEKKEDSYTCYLFEKGIDKMCKKIGEEAAEIIIAAKNNSADEIISESADFIYHLLVLFAQSNVAPKQVLKQLRSRRQQQR